MPTKDEFKTFIKKSGLKKQFVAEKIDIPYWIIAKWLRDEAILYPKQHSKLDEFITDYRENNNFMKTEREIENENQD